MGDVINLRFVQIRRDFDCQRHIFAMRGRQLRLFVFQGFQQCAQFVAALQGAQVFRIGGGNIDRNVARVGVGFFQANQIIVGRIFNRRNGIFADVDAQNLLKRLFSMLRIIASMPWLLKPMRLMMPWCSGTRKRRG